MSAVYCGSTQLWPVASGSAKLTISGPSGFFTGDGTSLSTAFSLSGGLYLNATGLGDYSWTATASATVYVSYTFSDDTVTGQVSKILIGTSSLFSTGMDGEVSKNFSVSPGNVVKISATGDLSQMFFSNMKIYAL